MMHLWRLIFPKLESWLFLIACFVPAALLAGPVSALVTIVFLAVCSRAGSLFFPVSTFSETRESLAQLFSRALLGIGLYSLLWTVCGLWSRGIIHTYLAFFILLILGLAAALKRMGKPQAARTPPRLSILVLGLLPLLLLLIMGLPFHNLGKREAGGQAYRAYFSTDYLKGFSIVQALDRQTLPPENPYFAGEKLHYYWIPYALPASVFSLTHDVSGAMVAFSVVANILLMGLLFWAFWGQCSRSSTSPLLCLFFAFVPVLFLSWEGLYLFATRLLGTPLVHWPAQVKLFNVDGLTRWLWNTPQVDSLLRTLLFMPQAAISCAAFALYLRLGQEEGSPFWLRLLCLFFSLTANVLIGIGFAVYFFCDLLLETFGERGQEIGRRVLFRRLLYSLIFMLGALALLLGLKIITVSGRGIAVRPLAIGQILPFFLLNLGALLLMGLWSAAARWRHEPTLFASVALMVIMGSLRIEGFESDLSLKLALVLQIIFSSSVLGLLIRAGHKSRLSMLLLLVCLLPGLPTALMDIGNSSDVHNRSFTYHLPDEERVVLSRARQRLAPGNVVQDFPPARSEGISIIPTFMARSTWVGDRMHSRIFLVAEQRYQERIETLRRLFQDGVAGREELLSLGIDYLFWGRPESEAFGYIPKLKVESRAGDTVLFSLR